MKAKKYTVIILICALMLIMAFTLTACKKDNAPSAENERTKAISKMVSATVIAVNNGWEVSYNNEQIALLEDCGEYVVAREWIGFVANVIDKSNLQTAKINNLANIISKSAADGLNPDDFYAILTEAQLTSTDIENLVYDLLVALSTGAEQIYNNCIVALNELKPIPQTSTARENLNNMLDYSTRVRDMIEDITNLDASLPQVLSDAESAIKTVVGLAYRLSDALGANGANMIEELLSGGIVNASTADVATYLQSVINSLDLLLEMTPAEIESLERAISVLLSTFDGLVLPYQISDILKYARYVYIGIDYLPEIAARVKSAANTLLAKDSNDNYAALSDAIKAFTDEDYNVSGDIGINKLIIYARLLLGILNIDINSADLEGEIDASLIGVQAILNEVDVNGVEDYQKSMVLLYAEIFANGNEAKYLDESVYLDIVNASLADAFLQTFKSNFALYLLSEDKASTEQSLRAAAKAFDEQYGPIQGIDIGGGAINSNWYNTVVSFTQKKLSDIVNDNIQLIIEDLNKHLEDLFNKEIYGVLELAKSGLIRKDDIESFDALRTKLAEYGITI